MAVHVAYHPERAFAGLSGKGLKLFGFQLGGLASGWAEVSIVHEQNMRLLGIVYRGRLITNADKRS